MHKVVWESLTRGSVC